VFAVLTVRFTAVNLAFAAVTTEEMTLYTAAIKIVLTTPIAIAIGVDLSWKGFFKCTATAPPILVKRRSARENLLEFGTLISAIRPKRGESLLGADEDDKLAAAAAAALDPVKSVLCVAAIIISFVKMNNVK
jgi:hypothetical protein